jgi:hypothetical protein
MFATLKHRRRVLVLAELPAIPGHLLDLTLKPNATVRQQVVAAPVAAAKA